ncbi:MAG TPA: DUF2970 domain-containing protein [Burkholderiaceae bacterium]|jgi:hypothetical protein|nr:DUF2970 domain-containing protein [Burkholderiaceae bacterium]
MNPIRYVRMVLWSFFGIRNSRRAGEELAQTRPLPLLVTAVVLAACIAGTLISLALFAASHFGS